MSEEMSEDPIEANPEVAKAIETIHRLCGEKDPNGLGQHDPGAKLDHGKIQAGILLQFGRALEAVAEVCTYGAGKYSRGGWQHVENGTERYTDAMMRHLLAEGRSAEDEESGLAHAAHAAWNALARLEFMLKEGEDG